MNQLRKGVRPDGGLRCGRLSTFHRSLGAGFPAVDLDFVEADWEGQPLALLSVKLAHSHITKATAVSHLKDRRYSTSWESKVYKGCANRMSVPAYVLMHDRDLSWFLAYPINQLGREKMMIHNKKDHWLLTDDNFPQFMAWLRNKEPFRQEETEQIKNDARIIADYENRKEQLQREMMSKLKDEFPAIF